MKTKRKYIKGENNKTKIIKKYYKSNTKKKKKHSKTKKRRGGGNEITRLGKTLLSKKIIAPFSTIARQPMNFNNLIRQQNITDKRFRHTRIPKSSNIIPYEDLHEEGRKQYKSNKAKEEFIRQNVPNFISKKEKKDEEDDEDQIEEYSSGEGDKYFEGEKGEKGEEKADISDFGRELYPRGVLTASLFNDHIRSSLETTEIIKKKFNSEVEKIFEKISDETLKQKVIQYNNETKDTIFLKNVGENFIKIAASNLAIAKYRVVQIADNIHYYGSKIAPYGIATTYKLINYDTIISITSMIISPSSEDQTYWSDEQNIEEYRKNLVTVLDNILGVILKDLTKQGCNNSIPKILKKIINPASVDKIVDFVKGEAVTNPNVGLLVDNSTDFCNKILPVVSKYFKENGFRKGVGEPANKLIDSYLNTSLSIFKEILWDILQNTTSKLKDYSSTYIDNIFDNKEISYSFSEQEKRNNYDELFNISSVNNLVKKLSKIAEQVRLDYDDQDKMKQDKMKQVIQELNTGTIPQEIDQEENNLHQNINELIEDKIKITDFITNLSGAIMRLLKLWDKEIYKHRLDNDLSKVDCLLNIIDIRINTLVEETCTHYAKGLLPENICNEKFYKLIENYYTKPIEEINNEDLKNTIKNIIIDAMIVKVKNKSLELIPELYEKMIDPTYANIFGYHCFV